MTLCSEPVPTSQVPFCAEISIPRPTAMVVGLVPSRSWSAVQSQEFSQYEEEVLVKWACMKAALQGADVDWQEISVRESAAPPTRV